MTWYIDFAMSLRKVAKEVIFARRERVCVWTTICDFAIFHIFFLASFSLNCCEGVLVVVQLLCQLNVFWTPNTAKNWSPQSTPYFLGSMHKKKVQAGWTFSFKRVLCHFVYHLWIVEWCVNCWKIFMNSYVYNSCRKRGVVLMSFNYVPSLQRMQGLHTLHSLLNTCPWVSKKFHMHSKLKIYFQICKI